MKKKKIINFTITESLIKKFNIVAKQNAINKSQLIENYILKWIEKNENSVT